MTIILVILALLIASSILVSMSNSLFEPGKNEILLILDRRGMLSILLALTAAYIMVTHL